MDLRERAEANLERHLKRNPYPGRGLVIGRSAGDEAWLLVYWIMGRSVSSRSRRFVADGAVLRTEPTDPDKLERPELTIYEAMLDLPSGRLDGYISDIPALEYFIKDKQYFKIIERIATGETYSMMFAKGNPLAIEVNGVITELKQEGYVAELHKRWFSNIPAETSSTVRVAELPSID